MARMTGAGIEGMLFLVQNSAIVAVASLGVCFCGLNKGDKTKRIKVE